MTIIMEIGNPPSLAGETAHMMERPHGMRPWRSQVEVTSELRDIIQQLFDMTTQSELEVGNGGIV